MKNEDKMMSVQKNNYLNLNGDELDQSIYRIFSLERFFQVLHKK